MLAHNGSQAVCGVQTSTHTSADECTRVCRLLSGLSTLLITLIINALYTESVECIHLSFKMPDACARMSARLSKIPIHLCALRKKKKKLAVGIERAHFVKGS